MLAVMFHVKHHDGYFEIDFDVGEVAHYALEGTRVISLRSFARFCQLSSKSVNRPIQGDVSRETIRTDARRVGVKEHLS